MNNGCIDISIYGEKNYKLFLEAIKQELDLAKYTDLTPIQALILLNISDNVLTIGEVMSRGYYLGSNASYNIKKLTNTGYISTVPSDYDRRAIIIKLTKKGCKLKCSQPFSFILFNQGFKGFHGLSLKNEILYILQILDKAPSMTRSRGGHLLQQRSR